MRRLRICIGVLSALLVALIVRAVIAGPNAAVLVALTVTAVPLFVSLALWRQGSRLNPKALRSHPPGSRRVDADTVASSDRPD